MNDQSTKNKDAISSNGMAATSHPLATEEAIKILITEVEESNWSSGGVLTSDKKN